MTNAIASTAVLAYDAARDGELPVPQIDALLDPALHSVTYYARKADGTNRTDHNFWLVPEKVVQTADIAEAERLYRDHAMEVGQPFSASVQPAAEIFGEDLAGYIAAFNIEARFLQENPREGSYVGMLSDDLEHWAKMGIHTALDLAEEFEREAEKAARKSWD